MVMGDVIKIKGGVGFLPAHSQVVLFPAPSLIDERMELEFLDPLADVFESQVDRGRFIMAQGQPFSSRGLGGNRFGIFDEVHGVHFVGRPAGVRDLRFRPAKGVIVQGDALSGI